MPAPPADTPPGVTIDELPSTLLRPSSPEEESVEGVESSGSDSVLPGVVDRLSRAVETLAARPTPQEAPVVNVNVPRQEPPVVKVNVPPPPPPPPVKQTVEYDREGRIVSVTRAPLEPEGGGT